MLLLKILLCFLSKQLCWTKEAVRMTHLKVLPAFPGSKCWRVWQQVLPSSGKANRCASKSLQFAPKPKFETNYSSLKLMIHYILRSRRGAPYVNLQCYSVDPIIISSRTCTIWVNFRRARAKTARKSWDLLYRIYWVCNTWYLHMAHLSLDGEPLTISTYVI